MPSDGDVNEAAEVPETCNFPLIEPRRPNASFFATETLVLVPNEITTTTVNDPLPKLAPNKAQPTADKPSMGKKRRSPKSSRSEGPSR